MRFLSLFSGIEAASQAWCPLGWECVAVAEIEKLPSAVMAHHYPAVTNLGDITKITREQIEALGHIDVVVMGFPCQDLSVAGKRKGLTNADGTNTRSGLFFVASQICEWSKSRWVVGENVPGLFSVHEGRDFASVVGELAGAEMRLPADGWRNSGVALGPKGLLEWAVLDAQYTGLAQRRERVFIIRDSGDWSNRPPLFFDAKGLRWDSPPSRETRERIAPTISARTKGGGGLGTDFDLDGGVICNDVSEPLRSGGANGGKSHGKVNGTDRAALIVAPVGIDGGETGFALRSTASHSGDKGDGGVNTTMVVGPLTSHPYGDNDGRESMLVPTVAATLRACSSTPAGHQTRAGDKDETLISFRSVMGGNDGGIYSDGSTSTMGSRCIPAIAHSLRAEGFDASEDGTGRGIPLTVGCLSDGAHNGGRLNGQDAYTGRIIPANQPMPECGRDGAVRLRDRDAAADASRRFL